MTGLNRSVVRLAFVLAGLAVGTFSGLMARADQPPAGNPPAASKTKPAAKATKAAASKSEQGEDPESIQSAWETRVRAALKRESSAKGDAQDDAVRELVALYEQLTAAKGIDKDERAALRGLVRNRLARSGERIAKRVEKAKKSPAVTASHPAVTANQLVASAGSAADKPYAAGNSAAAAGGQGAPKARAIMARNWSS